jgi:hypothetical protein
MTITEIKTIIKESYREHVRKPDSDEDLDDEQQFRKFNNETIIKLIDYELNEIENVLFDIGRKEFVLKEEDPDKPPIYEELDVVDKHLNAIRNLAEIKSYLEARNAVKTEIEFVYEKAKRAITKAR